MDARNPVLLIHGIDDTAALFETLAPYLQAQAWETHCLNLTPNDGTAGLDVLAEQVKAYADEHFDRDRPFDLLGFSMGGIVSRYYLQRLEGWRRVQRFITISSPHNGTWTAYARWNRGAEQLRPDSPFLVDLKVDAAEKLGTLNFTSIWTPLDAMIVPASSSQMSAARDVPISVALHPWMVKDERVLEAVAIALREPPRSGAPTSPPDADGTETAVAPSAAAGMPPARTDADSPTSNPNHGSLMTAGRIDSRSLEEARMVRWNSTNIRQAANLSLSEAERAAILAKLPQTETGIPLADAVFEGGGVKGFAFLGALRCFSDVGMQWRRVAGTSAGAITAALVVAGLPMAELEATIGQLDFEEEFLSRKTSPLIFNGSPGDDLVNPQWMIPNLLAVGALGQYSTDPFKQWLEQVLGDRGIRTFQDIIHQRQGRALKVVISDISLGKMVVLPDDLHWVYPGLVRRTVDFDIAEAVRLSMSIPFFFTPGMLAGSTIVDGGILSNFPLWIYDVTTPHRRPQWPTFGFRISEEMERQPVKNALDIFTGMLQTMMVASDRYHIQQYAQERVINIDTSIVTATEFNLTAEAKDELYKNGYLATKEFLLETWDWEAHLRTRGYGTPRPAATASPAP